MKISNRWSFPIILAVKPTGAVAIARKDWRTTGATRSMPSRQVLQPIVWLTPVYFMGQALASTARPWALPAYSGTSDYMSFILIGVI